MKKFLSVLLVAVLALTCCTAAFAAEPGSVYVETKTAEPGDVVELAVTVSGEFANYEIIFNTAAELTITAFNGVTGNPANGKVAFAKDENVPSHTFTITIAVSEDAAPGKYPVNADVLFVADRNLVDLDVSDAVGYIVIEGEPEETTAPTTEPEETTAPTTEPEETTVPPTEPEETTPPPSVTVPDDEPPVGKYDFAVVNGVMMSVMVLSAAAYVVLKRNAVK